MVEQKNIKIGNVLILVIKDGKEIWYPISYVWEKVLLKANVSTKIAKNYSQYIKKHDVDYGLTTGGIQNVKCISEIGLKEVLNNSKIGRLSVEQKQAMNLLLKHFKMDKVSEEESFTKHNDKIKNKLNEYNVFVKDCIDEVLKENNNIIWQKCSKCNNYYPYHFNFFLKNYRTSRLNCLCRECDKSNSHMMHTNDEFNKIYTKQGLTGYLQYRENDIIKIYKNYVETNKKFVPKKVPELLNTKETYLKIIKHCLDDLKHPLNKDNITVSNIIHMCKLFLINIDLSLDEIYTYLFGEDYKYYPWRYKSMKLNMSETNMGIAKRIFNNYLEEYNIVINDVYSFDYSNIAYKCGLKNFALNNILEFVMCYYNNTYAAYKFKISAVNYWKSKENRIRALKYFIEEDLKIPIEKIPLYLTIMTLQRQARTLYGILYSKKYYKNLFEWVDEVYPNKFIEADFCIGVIRNEFDSIEEGQIHDVLKENFNNVIYNQRNTDNTITINGMQPDWVIFSDNGCVLVEYFGMYQRGQEGNSRIKMYMGKMNRKLDKYKDINGYGQLFLYPEDLDDNMKGLIEKIDKFKNFNYICGIKNIV